MPLCWFCHEAAFYFYCQATTKLTTQGESLSFWRQTDEGKKMESSEHSERGQVADCFFPPWQNCQTHCQRTPRLPDRVFLCQAIEVSCLSNDRYSFPLICFKDFYTKRSWKCIKFQFMKMFIDWSFFLIQKNKINFNTTIMWPFFKGHAIINTKVSKILNWLHELPGTSTEPVGDQRRLRRACADRQSLRCSHTWCMEVDEESAQKSHI